MDRKSHNMQALAGYDIDDMEYVQLYSFPVEVAYTKEINNLMLDKVYNENVETFLNEGNTELTAKKKASAIRTEKKGELKELYAKNGLL